MTRLGRYVLKSFLKPLLFSYGAMTLLVLMAELMERLDKIIAGKADLGVIARYLLALWPVRSLELLPVAALLAILLSLGQLSRRMEITAAMSGGVHPWKLTAPLLSMGVVLSLFSLGLSEGLTPWANRQVKKLWNTDIRRLTHRKPTRFYNITVAGPRVFYAIGTLDLEKGRMENVVIDLVRDGRPDRQIQARTARWEESGWTLRNGFERVYRPDGRGIERVRGFQKSHLDRNDPPANLVPQEPDPDDMSQFTLRHQIQRLKSLGIATQKFEVELYMKTALPWSNLVIVFLGIPFAFNKRGGKVRAVAVALAVAFAYFGLLQVGRALGQKPWCPPLLGAWTANFVFLAIGGRLFWRMRSLA